MSTLAPSPGQSAATAPPPTGPTNSAAWSTANTPGWYRSIGALAVALIIIFAVLATTATLITRSSSQAIQSNTAPSLIAVQGLSASVAEANAAATGVFLSGATGTEDRTRRVLYLDALRRSAEQTEEVAGLVGDDGAAHDALQSVSVALNTYSGLIEASRTANQLEQPDADEPLRQALDLTQVEIAGSIAALTEQNQQRFDDDAGTGLILTVIAFVAGSAAVLLLVWFQLGVFHRSNRVLNIGLLLATVFLLATLAVISNGAITRSLALSNADDGGYDSIVATSGLQASAYELQSQLSLQLLGAASGDLDAITATLDSNVELVATDADSTRERAAAEELALRWDRYRQSTQSMAALADGGSNAEAIALFQGDGLSTFNGLNTGIESVLLDNRVQFSDGVAAAADAVNLLPLFSIVLPALAVLGVVLGVQGRLRDYQ